MTAECFKFIPECRVYVSECTVLHR